MKKSGLLLSIVTIIAFAISAFAETKPGAGKAPLLPEDRCQFLYEELYSKCLCKQNDETRAIFVEQQILDLKQNPAFHEDKFWSTCVNDCGSKKAKKKSYKQFNKDICR